MGNASHGANSTAVAPRLINVNKIFATDSAFAALKDDGTVVTWGSSSNGGDSSGVAAQLTDVVSIANTSEAFTALKADGTVVSWGNSARGGSITNFVGSGLNNILYVVGSLSGFSAQKEGW